MGKTTEPPIVKPLIVEQEESKSRIDGWHVILVYTMMLIGIAFGIYTYLGYL